MDLHKFNKHLHTLLNHAGNRELSLLCNMQILQRKEIYTNNYDKLKTYKVTQKYQMVQRIIGKKKKELMEEAELALKESRGF